MEHKDTKTQRADTTLERETPGESIAIAWNAEAQSRGDAERAIVCINKSQDHLCGGSRESGEPRVQGRGGSPVPERGVGRYKNYGAAGAAKEASKTFIIGTHSLRCFRS